MQPWLKAFIGCDVQANELHLSRALSVNPNGFQIHQPRVGGPRRMGHPRLSWETVPQIHQRRRQSPVIDRRYKIGMARCSGGL
jgi:hypothetical protein